MLPKYRLWGVVEHSGSMSGGHYVRGPVSGRGFPRHTNHTHTYTRTCSQQVAYVRTMQRQQGWFYISDASVSSTSEARVLGAQAFMLFYVRTDALAAAIGKAVGKAE